MKKCGKSRCQICSYVEEAEEFEYGNKKYWINYPFDWDSEGVIYVIRCISCSKIYVGSTITTFRKRCIFPRFIISGKICSYRYEYPRDLV